MRKYLIQTSGFHMNMHISMHILTHVHRYTNTQAYKNVEEKNATLTNVVIQSTIYKEELFAFDDG